LPSKLLVVEIFSVSHLAARVADYRAEVVVLVGSLLRGSVAATLRPSLFKLVLNVMLRAVTGKRLIAPTCAGSRRSFTAGGRWRAAACGRGSKQRCGRRRKRRRRGESGVGFGPPRAGRGSQQGSKQEPGGSRRWRRPEIEKKRRARHVGPHSSIGWIRLG